jgi:hypothetical protein
MNDVFFIILHKFRPVASLLFLLDFRSFYYESQLCHALLSLQTAVNFEETDRHNGCVFHRPNRLHTVINQLVT